MKYYSSETYGLKPIKPKSLKDPVEILKNAMRVLSNPKRWLKDRETVKRYGTFGNGEVRFCAIGAVKHFGGDRSLLDRACKHGDIVEINDAKKTSHAKIMRKFRHAIRLAEKDRQK